MRSRRLELRFDPKVPKQLGQLPKREAAKVLTALERLTVWPTETGDVKALAGEFKGLYRLRVGRYRVHFDVDLDAGVLHVLSVATRQQAYR